MNRKRIAWARAALRALCVAPLYLPALVLMVGVALAAFAARLVLRACEGVSAILTRAIEALPDVARPAAEDQQHHPDA